jgi:cytochrome P450
MGGVSELTVGVDRRAADPPGPFFWEPFTPARELLRDPLGTLERMRRDYGDVVRSRIGPIAYYALFRPEHVKHILQDNNHNYVKGPIIARAKVLIGDGLFSSEGEFWRRQRKLAQPAFHRQRIGAFADAMTECGREALDAWSGAAATGSGFDLMAEMSRVTLRVVGKTLFSLDLAGDASAVGDALLVALDHVVHRSFNLVVAPAWLPTPRNLRFRRALRVLDDVVLRIIESRRRTGEDCGDLLSMLLAARDEETGTGMNDGQLRDEVMTFVLAGHETTAVTLAWTWYLLCRHREIEQRLRDEVAAAIGRRTPGFGDLPALRYVRMVVEESLRLYPPLWAFGRQAVAEDRIDGYRIAAGAPVNLCPWITHRDPAVWPDPERFDPERFTPERVAARHRFAYLPFSGGPRICIGIEFALMEATLLVAMIAQRYRVELAEPEREVVPEVRLTIRPRGGLPVRVRAA